MKKRSFDDPLKMGIKRGQTCDKNDQNQTAKKIALRSFFYTKFVNKSYWKVAHFRPGPLQGQISRIRGSGLGIGFVNIGFVNIGFVHIGFVNIGFVKHTFRSGTCLYCRRDAS